MSSRYKEKIFKEIEAVPEEMMGKLYKCIHLLATELIPTGKKTGRRGSLKGIWKGSQINESSFLEAKESLFTYEHK